MERNITLDYFKIFLSVLVVTIHFEPLFHINSLSSWLVSNGIARIAVPSFFIINGYYIYSKITSKTALISWLKRMITIFVVWTLIYFALLTNSDSLTVIISSITGIYHLWYLPALIGGVIILAIIKKVMSNNVAILLITIILYLIGYYIQDHFFPISNSGYRMNLYRNCLFFGFPFIFGGFFIKDQYDKLSKIKTSYLFIIVAISTVTLLLESDFYFIHNSRKDFFLSLPFLIPSLFILILKMSKYVANDGYFSSMASGIFYTHVLSICIVNTIFPITEFKIYTLPLVLFLTIILSCVTIQLNKRIKIFL